MEYLTIEELCKILNIEVPNRSTIWRWRKQGMPYIKLGREIRYEKEAVLKWLKERSENHAD